MILCSHRKFFLKYFRDLFVVVVLVVGRPEGHRKENM